MAKPKIRFKGYQEDWEQRKLGDVFQEYSEKNYTESVSYTHLDVYKRQQSLRRMEQRNI